MFSLVFFFFFFKLILNQRLWTEDKSEKNNLKMKKG